MHGLWELPTALVDGDNATKEACFASGIAVGYVEWFLSVFERSVLLSKIDNRSSTEHKQNGFWIR